MEFSAIQQFPLHFLSGLQADSGGWRRRIATVRRLAPQRKFRAQRTGDRKFSSEMPVA